MDLSRGIVSKRDRSTAAAMSGLRRLLAPATLCLAALLVFGASCKKAEAPPPLPTATPPPMATLPPTVAAPPQTPAPVSTPRPTPTQTPSPTPTPPPAPATLDVPINVRGVANLGSLQLDIEYDPQALELQAVKAGPLARNALVDFNKSTPGVVKIGLVSTSGISGDGAVITLTFVPLGKGGPNNLNVSNIDAADTDLRDLVVSVTPGQFSGGSGQVTGPVLNFRK